MEIFFLFSILSMLLLITFQDFRERSISAWILPLLFIASAAYFILKYSWQQTLENFIINFLILSFQLLLLNIFFSVKQKQWVFLPDNLLGWGDILFLPIVCVFFSPLNMLIYYVVSLMLICLVFALIRIIFSPRENTVPLAGGLSLILAVFLAVNERCIKIDNYSDDALLRLFIPY